MPIDSTDLLDDHDLIVEEVGSVLVLTINRPQARNALTRTLAHKMAEVFDRLESRDDLRVAVITGAEGTFCAGMDLKRFLIDGRAVVEGRGFGGFTERPPRKPLIAAVEGFAVGGGFEMVLACDLVVAARDAVFSLPEVQRGLTAAGGGLVRIASRVPYNLAMELVLTGRRLSADEAASVHLVNRLVEPGEAKAAALDLAREISALAPLSVIASKAVLVGARTWTEEDMFERQRPLVDPVRASDDAKEGAKAFAEKRVPRWTGR